MTQGSTLTIHKSKKNLVNPIIVVSVIIALLISFLSYKLFINFEKKKGEEEFSRYVVTINSKMVELAINSENIVDEINKAWRDAVFSENKTDFNVAIMEVISKRRLDIISLHTLSTDIEMKLKSMSAPAGKEREFQRLKELYLLFNKYADMAISPSGSLQTYSEQNSRLVTEIKSAIKEMEMMKH